MACAILGGLVSLLVLGEKKTEIAVRSWTSKAMVWIFERPNLKDWFRRLSLFWLCCPTFIKFRIAFRPKFKLLVWTGDSKPVFGGEIQITMFLPGVYEIEIESPLIPLLPPTRLSFSFSRCAASRYKTLIFYLLNHQNSIFWALITIVSINMAVFKTQTTFNCSYLQDSKHDSNERSVEELSKHHQFDQYLSS